VHEVPVREDQNAAVNEEMEMKMEMKMNNYMSGRGYEAEVRIVAINNVECLGSGMRVRVHVRQELLARAHPPQSSCHLPRLLTC